MRLRRKSLAMLPIAVCALIAACSPAPLTEEAFAQKMIERVSPELPELTYTMNPDDPLEINVSGDPYWDEAQFNLHRIYGYCQTASAEDCEVEFEQFARAITQQTPEQTVADLRVIIRDAVYWQNAISVEQADGLVPVHRQIGEDLYAIMAFDSPNSIALAMEEDLASLDISMEEAWPRAIQQTQAGIPAVPVREADDLAQSLVAFEGQEYVGTMLIDFASWQRLAVTLGPDMIVTATSDQLVVAGVIPEGPDLEEFKGLVEQDCAAAPRCISPHVYRLREGRWVIAD